MKIHVGRRLFLAAAVLAAAAVLMIGTFVALEVRSVVAGPDAGPAAGAPNPGHSWSEIGDLPGTMWHSNDDGPGSGLDADTLDGLQSTQIQDADDYVSNAGHASSADSATSAGSANYAAGAGNADTVDGLHASQVGGLSTCFDAVGNYASGDQACAQQGALCVSTYVSGYADCRAALAAASCRSVPIMGAYGCARCCK